MEQPIVFVHGPNDAAATAAALALAGWGRGRQAIPGGKPVASGRAVIVGEDANGCLIVAAGRGPGADIASRALGALFGLAGLEGRLVLHEAETGRTVPLGPPAVGAGPAVVYACHGPAHVAATAAAVHTGMLPADRVPALRELGLVAERMPLTTPAGVACCLGNDADGRPVYAMGLGPQHELLRKLVRRAFRRLLAGPAPVMLISTAAAVHPLARWGGQLLQRWGLASCGRPLAAWGARKTYRQLAGIAAATVRELGRSHGTSRAIAGVDHGQAISHTRWQDLRPPTSSPQQPLRP